MDQLVRSLCDTKQGYTQFGGLRPFGVSLLYAGWQVLVAPACAGAGGRAGRERSRGGGCPALRAGTCLAVSGSVWEGSICARPPPPPHPNPHPTHPVPTRPAGTSSAASSCTRATRRATTAGGRRRPSAPTTGRPPTCCRVTTKRTSAWRRWASGYCRHCTAWRACLRVQPWAAGARGHRRGCEPSAQACPHSTPPHLPYATATLLPAVGVGTKGDAHAPTTTYHHPTQPPSPPTTQPTTSPPHPGQAIKLVVKVLSKTMDSTTLSPDKVELATLSRDEDAGKVGPRRPAAP